MEVTKEERVSLIYNQDDVIWHLLKRNEWVVIMKDRYECSFLRRHDTPYNSSSGAYAFDGEAHDFFECQLDAILHGKVWKSVVRDVLSEWRLDRSHYVLELKSDRIERYKRESLHG